MSVNLDSGVAVLPTQRLQVFAAGMPAANPATDDGVNTATAAKAGCFQPGSLCARFYR